MPRSLPSALFLVPLTLLLAGVSHAAVPINSPYSTAPAATAFVSEYRGDPSNVVARCPWGELTEEGLFLYLVMTGDDEPLIYEKYVKATTPEERHTFHWRLEAVLHRWALLKYLASQERDGRLGSPVDPMRLRMLTYPVQELLWIDLFLVPQVEVLPEDVRKFYAENPDGMLANPRASARYIFLRDDPEGTTGAMQRLKVIRGDVITEDVSFPDAARSFSEAPSAKHGGLIEFEQGTLFTEFEQAVFDLDTGQISEIIRGPKGLYLIYCEAHEVETQRPLEEVEGIVRSQLALTQLQHRYNYEFDLLLSKTPITNLAQNIAGLDSDAPVLKSGDLELTRRQAWELFPGFVRQDFTLDGDALWGYLDRVGKQEVLAQFNRDRNWHTFPRMRAAWDLARTILLAERELARHAGPKLRLDLEGMIETIQDRPDIFPIPPATFGEELTSDAPPEPLPAAVERNPGVQHDLEKGPSTAFQALVAPRFSLIQARLTKGAKHEGSARRAWEIQRMREGLREMRDSFSTSTLEQVADAWLTRDSHPADLIPIRVERELKRRANALVEITRWSSVQGKSELRFSEQTLKDIQDVADTLPDWTAAGVRFLPLLETEDTATLFYVEQPDYTSPSVMRLVEMPLYRIVADAIRIETLEELRQANVTEENLEIILPPEGLAEQAQP